LDFVAGWQPFTKKIAERALSVPIFVDLYKGA
jgi:hypothetical protein